MGTESGIRNMTVGSPFRHILMFTLPLLAGNFLQQFYNMVDSWVVGNYVSDGALAAVGVGFPVIFLFTSLFSGIATGGTVVIAQSFGGGRPDRVRSAIDSLYTAFIRSILPITAAALLLVNPLMTVLRVDPAAWAETRTYLLVVCGGLIGSIGYNLNAGILGGMGNSSTTLLFLAVSTVLNIFLDLALVLAVPLGVLGVALGTVNYAAGCSVSGISTAGIRSWPSIPSTGSSTANCSVKSSALACPAVSRCLWWPWAPWAYSPRSTATERPSLPASTWAINWIPCPFCRSKVWPPL